MATIWKEWPMPSCSRSASRRGSEGIVERPGLRRAGAEDVPQLADVLAAAFYEDPPFVWMMPSDTKRRGRLRRFFEIELRAVGLAQGTVWTTPDLAGTALSTPPGRWRLPVSAMVRYGAAYGRAFGARLPHAGALLARIESRHSRQPHHYFPCVGVAPERQGQGVGSSLMGPTLACCDNAWLPAYLEASTERNAALYELLGFDLIDELHYGGSQPLRLMLRPPNTPSCAMR
jgi:GNAT superfamily N-acetyltransferase